MQFLNLALPLALAGSALANPLLRRDDCTPGDCLAAVTGKAALGDDTLRADHCKSFLATTVTPEAITTTVTVTGIETTTPGWGNWKRSIVTVCPNEVPNYASACTDTVAYSSACSCFGYSGDSTTTLDPTTTTKTVYVQPTGSCSGSVATTTITVTVSGVPYGTPSGISSGTSSRSTSGTPSGSFSTCPTASSTTITIPGTTITASGTTITIPGTTITAPQVTTTITTTETSTTCPAVTTSTTTTTTTTTSSGPEEVPTTCLAQSDVDNFIADFTNFLENTNNPVPGQFDSALAEQVFTQDFQDQSDSINYMAGIPLGQVTFDGVDAFIYGQGGQYPVGVVTLDSWVGCKFFGWRYKLITGLGQDRPIQGINIFEVTDDLSQIKNNYAEFDNAAWLQNIAEAQAAYAAAAAASTTTTSVAAPSTTTSTMTTTTSSPSP